MEGMRTEDFQKVRCTFPGHQTSQNEQGKTSCVKVRGETILSRLSLREISGISNRRNSLGLESRLRAKPESEVP